MSAANETEKKGGVGEFLQETRSEWDKTTFPSADDVRNTTIIVIISVIFVTIFLYVVDLGWVFLLDQLAKGASWLLG